MFCTSSQCNDVLTCTHCRQRRLLPGAASCWLPTTIAMIPSCMIYRVPLLLSGACTAPFNPDRAFQREHDKGSTGLCLSAPCGVALRTRFTPCSLCVCVCADIFSRLDPYIHPTASSLVEDMHKVTAFIPLLALPVLARSAILQASDIRFSPAEKWSTVKPTGHVTRDPGSAIYLNFTGEH